MTTKTITKEIADQLSEIRLQITLSKMKGNRWPAGAPGKKGGQFAPKSLAGGSLLIPQLTFGFGFGGASWASKAQPGPNAKPHPKLGEKGTPVMVNYPSVPSHKDTWTDPKKTATFTPGGNTPDSLNGVALKPWKAPTTLAGWSKVPGQMKGIDDDVPFVATPNKTVGSGVVILEPDGRVWLTKPTNEFGGYKHTYPKGTAEPGLSLQANAIKEAYEETGLKVRIVGILGDVDRDTSKARYYVAVREGGTPKDMGWETQAMRLAPRSQLKNFLNKPHDQQLVDRLAAAEKVKKAKVPSKGAWSAQPRWEAGTPIGGQWKSFDAAGLPLPPKVGSTTNTKWQNLAQAAYTAAAAGDKGPAMAVAQIAGKKLTEFNEKQAAKQAINSQLKWAAGAAFYAKALIDAKASSVKAAATAEKISGPQALSGWSKTAAKPGGSNPGAIYSDGEDKWLVKGNAKLVSGAVTQTVSDDRAKNEILAAKLMLAAGVGAPEMKLVNLEGQHGGGLGVASKMIDGVTAFDKNNPAHLAAAQADFAVHAWLSNYDVVGMSFDNLVMKDGKAVNIDPGGALLFRAQGLPKDKLGTAATEMTTLRDPKINAQAAAVFGSMTTSQIAASAKKLAVMTDDVIDKLVDAHGPGDAAGKADLAFTLKKRRDYIFGFAGLDVKGQDPAASVTPAAPPPAPPPGPAVQKPAMPTFAGPNTEKFQKVAAALLKQGAITTANAVLPVVIDGKRMLQIQAGTAKVTIGNPPISKNGKALLQLVEDLKVFHAIPQQAPAATPSAGAAKPAEPPSPIKSPVKPTFQGGFETQNKIYASIADKLENLSQTLSVAEFAALKETKADASVAISVPGNSFFAPGTGISAKESAIIDYHQSLLDAKTAAKAAAAHAAQPAPVQDPPKPGQAKANAPAMPNLAKYKLDPAKYSQPGTIQAHNKAVEAIEALAAAGDVTGLLAKSYSSNTYGKKQALAANDALAALGSAYKVTAGQKANMHAAINGGLKPDVAAAALQNTGNPAPSTKTAPDPKKPVKVDPKILPPKTNFLTGGSGGAGISSKAWVNQSNTDLQEAIYNAALTGDIGKLQSLTYPELDKESGKPTGKVKPIGDHPSKHVQGYWSDSVAAVRDAAAGPPRPLKVVDTTAAKNAADVAAHFPAKKLGTTVKHVKSNEKFGFWVALGSVSNPKRLAPTTKMNLSEGAIQSAYDEYKAMSPKAKTFVKSIQASGSFNDAYRDGKTEYQGNNLKELAKAAYGAAKESPAGTTVYRWQNMPQGMLQQLEQAQPGLVFQSTGPMCTSYSPTATKGFGKHRIKIVYAPGAKAVHSFGSGGFQSEKEVSTLPGSRFVLLDKKEKDGRWDIEVLMLPPDPKYFD